MAADTRPYKSKEQDGQGNEIILRDQQLVEQASQTTMASGEYFEIVDVDGRMAKIPKANMVDIVREALGSLLNGLTDQTTVTKVPSLNGNTLGASTVATLASVLGVNGQLSNNVSFDSLTHNGNWYVIAHPDSPTSGTGVLVCKFASDIYGYQMFKTSTATYIRHYFGGWAKEWQRLDNFGCNTAADLASLLGGLLKIKSTVYTIEAGDVQIVSSTARAYIFVIDSYTANEAIDIVACVNGHNAVSLTGSDNPWPIHGKDNAGTLNAYCDGAELKLQNNTSGSCTFKITVIMSW